MLFNNSLRFHVNRLLIGTVILVCAVVSTTVIFATDQYSKIQISRDFDLGQNLLLNSLKEREIQLASVASILEKDLRFKQINMSQNDAVVNNIIASLNEYSLVDIMAIVSLEGKLLGKTTNFTGPLFSNDVLGQIIDQGKVYKLSMIDGKLYQTIMVTLNPSKPIAIAMIGLELEQGLLDRFSNMTRLGVTVFFDKSAPPHLTTVTQKNLESILKLNLQSDVTTGQNKEVDLPSSSLRFIEYQPFSGYFILSHGSESFKDLKVLVYKMAVIALFAVFIAFFVGIRFARYITKRLEYLSTISKKMSLGDYQNTVNVESEILELSHLSTSFKQMQLDVARRDTTMSFNANHDMVTGLYNRQKLIDLIQEKFSANSSFQAIAIQIYGFRELNETFGIKVGDECLSYLANEMRSKGGTCARVAGGEVIWLPESKMTFDQLNALRADMERSILVSQVKVTIKLVIGIVNSDDGLEEAEDLIRSLSIATSHACTKADNIQSYLPEQEAAYIQRIEVLYELQHLLESEDKNELAMFYQPKMSLLNDKVEKLEALIRWNSKKLGFVSPEMFIPIAESAGIIRALTQWIIRRVISDLASWELDNIQVAINLSAQDIVCDDIIQYINVCLIEFKVHPAQLSFEITESDIMSDPKRAIAQLNKFVELGFPLAIDDFGTGHSSLSYLKDFPVQTLKIDKAFIMQLDQNKDDQTIVKSINGLASDFGLNVVAEGVENRASLDMLRKVGCQFIQGYYISRPMPAKDVKAWLADFNYSDIT